MERALKRVLDFTQKYWFVDVSNQIQAREMYALWRSHLNTKALYEQVREEARAAAEYQDATENRRAADENRRATEATTRLTIAALLVAVPSLATSFLGMNILPSDMNSQTYIWFFPVFLLTSLIIAICVYGLWRLANSCLLKRLLLETKQRDQ